MLANMSAREWHEWQQYMQIEPVLAERVELMLAQLTALEANVNRDPKKRGEPYRPVEFMLDTRTERERQIEVAKRVEAKAWFDRMTMEAKARRAAKKDGG